MIMLDQASSGQTVVLPVGETIELRLPENPTTGFQWAFTANGSPVCIVMRDQFQAASGPPGRGGQHRWEIKGVAVGACDIAMQYRRSFQPAAVAGSFALHVRVTP